MNSFLLIIIFMRVHRISEYLWSKAGPYSKFHDQIKKILDGKIVFQWNGSDITIFFLLRVFIVHH
jgi:hypothetical protein